MSLYNEIDQLKSSVNQTSTETLPPGYIAGFDLSVIDARIYCGPGICNYNGKKMTFPTGRYLLDSEWVSKNKLPETVYYVYLTTGAAFFVDLNAPDFSAIQFGDYHPTLGYRYIGKAKTNNAGAIDIVANSRNIIAENIDFEAIEGSRIKAETIESKQLIIGDQTPMVGDPIPADVELFRYNDLACASNEGTKPVSKNVKLEQGEIGTVDNPWFYERRWTVGKGLVAAYTMNAGAGTVLRDDSGNFNDGTINGATWNSGGIDGYCLSFDGSDDYVQCTTITKTLLGSNFGISFRLKPTGGQSTKGIFQVADALTSAAPWILLQRENSTTVRWYLNGGYQISQSVADDEWCTIALTYNGTIWRSYKNGVAGNTYTGAVGSNTGTSTWFGNGYNGYYSGLIDDPRFYLRTTTEAEALSLHEETSPYEDVYEPPCDNAIWCGKTTTNLVRSTDLNNAVWTKSASYHTNYGNVFDPDLQKTVWKWNKGSQAAETYLYDTGGDIGGTGTYIYSIMVKCNYALAVRGFSYYNADANLEYTNDMLIPADTWTLFNARVTLANDPSGTGGWHFRLPGGGNFDSSIEFRACDPYVALESYPMPFAPTTRPAASLYYNYTWPQAGTVLFWVKPGFAYTKSAANSYFISDYNGTVFNIAVFWDKTLHKFEAIIDGTTSVIVTGTEITSNSDLWKWWLVAVTYDISNDSLKLYCYSDDYPTGDNSSSTSDLGTVTFQNYLSVGGVPLYSSPANIEADSFIAGLVIDDTVWDEATIKAHYDTGRVYYDPNVIQNYSRGVAIDKNGILIKDGSVNIIDNYGREIDISNQSGLMAKDASGRITHDIPVAIGGNSYPCGHLVVPDMGSTNFRLVNNDFFTALGQWTDYLIKTEGNTNIKAVLLVIYFTTTSNYIGLRPKGSSWASASTYPHPITNNLCLWATGPQYASVTIACPVDSNGYFQIADGAGSRNSGGNIFQIGYFI